MLEQFNKAGRALIVRKTKQKRRKKNKKNNKKTTKENPKVIKSLEEKWDDIGPELSAVMEDGVIPDVIPFDATLDSPIEEQKYLNNFFNYHTIIIIYFINFLFFNFCYL